MGGNGPVGTRTIIRALGPSLSTAGITDPLADPALEVRDSSGTLVASNNNWQDAPVAQRAFPPFQPNNALESALHLVLRGGAYTAVVSNADGTTGTALVEVYNLPEPEHMPEGTGAGWPLPWPAGVGIPSPITR